MIYGIERFAICGGQRVKHHEEMAKIETACRPEANDIYREIFPLINPIEKEDRVDVLSRNAKRDLIEGIDVVLNLRDGKKVSVQEKFLTYHKDTLTVQVQGYNGKRGTWYTCSANFYLVAYAKAWPTDPALRSWILVDRQLLAGQSNLPWKRKANQKDGQVEFDYLQFDEVPADCIYAQSF